jgi:hypothetical protein
MIMQKERTIRERSRKNSIDISCDLENRGPEVIIIGSNCPDIKTYLIIKIILFICLDIGGKISIIRTALRLHDL